jgi:pSer/pThr/pTyr-binding forkhead associated (FHA) protein
MLFLELLNGPKKGKKIEIFDQMIIGRSKSDLILQDSKASSQHAKIIEENGIYTLKDLGSRNGLKVGKKKLTKLVLSPGVEVQIGSHLMKVSEISDKAIKERLQKPKPTPEAHLPKNVATLHKVLPKKKLTWQESIGVFLKAAIENSENQVNPKLMVFDKTCKLQFLDGIQTSSTYELQYGPRNFGNACLEFPIYEEDAPDLCFQITQAEEGLSFYTPYPETVLLNGQGHSVQILKNNDEIQINNTIIKVII